jgi:hypothetical protein
MTIREAVKLLGIDKETFDTALPQPWLDSAVKKTGADYHKALSSFVWLYDSVASIAGRPFALTSEGNRILRLLNEKEGASYLLTERAILLNRIGQPIQPATWEEFLAQFDEEVHSRLREVMNREGVSSLVMFENQMFDSSAFGQRTALCVGSGCTYKSVEEAAGMHLGEVPSRFQYPLLYTSHKEGANSA